MIDCQPHPKVPDHKPTITADQFEREFAERCGKTVEEMRARGRRVRPCACDYVDCQGWQYLRGDALADFDDPAQPWAR